MRTSASCQIFYLFDKSWNVDLRELTATQPIGGFLSPLKEVGFVQVVHDSLPELKPARGGLNPPNTYNIMQFAVAWSGLPGCHDRFRAGMSCRPTRRLERRRCRLVAGSMQALRTACLSRRACVKLILVA